MFDKLFPWLKTATIFLERYKCKTHYFVYKNICYLKFIFLQRVSRIFYRLSDYPLERYLNNLLKQQVRP